jgi:hypothetical protein
MTATPLDELVGSYCDVWWAVDPVAATAVGARGHDHRLGSYTEEEVSGYLAALKSLAGALEECTVDSLDDEIDRTALLGQIRSSMYRFEHETPHVRDPIFWASHALEGVHRLLLASDRTADEQARAAVGRIRDIPNFLQDARATLRESSAVLARTAIQLLRNGPGLIDVVAQAFPPADEPEFPTLCERARVALREFADDLENDVAEDEREAGFAIGEEAFNFRLHFQHALRATAPELWRFGMHLVEDTEAEVAALAAKIDPGNAWQDVVARLREDHLAGDALLESYRTEMERARRFVEDRGLVAIPDGELRVMETPPFLQPLIPFAAYQPPQALASSRVGWFYVTPGGPGATGRAERDHSRHAIPATSLHEGYPGHHLQLLTAYEQPRLIRKLIWSPLTVEGWALYCEEMMGEEGYYTSLEEQLFQKTALLLRACRVVVDIGLHTRGWTVPQGVAFLQERVQHERELVEAEVHRYCAEPVYQLCYAVGRRELLGARDAYRRARGTDTHVRAFHDEVLRFGGLPVALIRWGLGLDE